MQWPTQVHVLQNETINQWKKFYITSYTVLVTSILFKEFLTNNLKNEQKHF